jgi:hypothetical protein
METYQVFSRPQMAFVSNENIEETVRNEEI